MFTAFDEEIYAMRFLKAGASGYLNKVCSEDEMKLAINNMILSGKYITQNVKDRILDSYMSKRPSNPLEQLSNREVEIARLMIKGYGKKCVPYQVWAKDQAKDFEKRLRQSIQGTRFKK